MRQLCVCPLALRRLAPCGKHPLPVQIDRFAPATASRAEWDVYHAYRRQRAAEEFPDLPLFSDQDFEQDARRQYPFMVNHRFVAMRAGEIVGNMIIAERRAGTPGYHEFAPHVDVFGGVLKQQRRRGVGYALFSHLYEFMCANGKALASTKVMFPDGHGFLATGAQMKLRSAEHRLSLSEVGWNDMPVWRSKVGAEGSALRWEIHAPRVPLERLAQLMASFSQISNEQPLGELEMPRIRYEHDAFRSWYQDLDARGGEHYLVLLTAASEVVALCEANWDARVPAHVYQSFTGVAASWRGRGLAKAMKAAMLLLVRERRPEVTTFITRNAQSNGPMLSINQQFCFRLQREECTYQLGRELLGLFLGRSPGAPVHTVENFPA